MGVRTSAARWAWVERGQKGKGHMGEGMSKVMQELDREFLRMLIEEHQRVTAPRMEKLWKYYRNPWRGSDGHGRRRVWQEKGLPARLQRSGLESGREVVVENDIAWRVQTMVDFMFGRAFSIQSMAGDTRQAERIEAFLRGVFEGSGGVGFFQDLALLGSVYGHVDVLVRAIGAPAGMHSGSAGGRGGSPGEHGRHVGGEVILELVEAPRAVAVLDPDDYRRIEAFVVHHVRELNEVEPTGAAERWGKRMLGLGGAGRRASVEVTRVWTDQCAYVLEGPAGEWELAEREVNVLGRVPVVHIQNLPQPFCYGGLSEVEALIPLQDELNTRLSDRANRVTFQSFKMYLGKGIEKFTERPVGPGQMWATDNPEASIEEFGGDSANPSEDAHIQEIREAMDKTSGVPPLAAGLLGAKVGNLTSESALRVVLMGLLSKTERKRVSYGAGIERMCELVLELADVTGMLPNSAEDRGVRIDWPSALPENLSQKLAEAKAKVELGVPVKQVLMELGYGDVV